MQNEIWLFKRRVHVCTGSRCFLPGAFRVQEKRGRRGAEVPAEAGHPLKVVTTLFPYYDFTRQIAGENIELSMVIPAGMDSHSFEPTPADIRLIEEADLFICNGGHMEQWVSQVLSSSIRRP